MAQFDQIFTAHPVGQGLFYTGIIKYRGARGNEGIFRLVFDCGSLNLKNCEEEVDVFINRHLPGNTPIDLLVISHFDQDHINLLPKLLQNRQVTHIVAPFINYTERLTLALEFIQNEGSNSNPNRELIVECIIDPVTALSRLGGNPIFTFIISNGNESFSFKAETFEEPSGENNEGNYAIEFAFEGDFTAPVVEDRIGLGENVRLTPDTNPGLLKFQVSRRPIMDFLFYRVDLGSQTKEFFDKVHEEFLNEFGMSDDVEIIKKISSATRIRKVFNKAKNAVGLPKMADIPVGNMNSTSLSMLHRNRVSFYNFMFDLNPAHHGPFWNSFSPTIIQKHDGTNATRTEQELNFGINRWDLMFRHFHHESRPFDFDTKFIFPNTLLTSDSFLLDANRVNEFHRRYVNYWNDFWLFQIPHHGSKHNADQDLFNRLPLNTFKFMNYGAKKIRKWRHPSPELVMNLVASGASKRLLPITEYQGLQFHYSLII